jgi:hypothetical protein
MVLGLFLQLGSELTPTTAAARLLADGIATPHAARIYTPLLVGHSLRGRHRLGAPGKGKQHEDHSDGSLSHLPISYVRSRWCGVSRRETAFLPGRLLSGNSWCHFDHLIRASSDRGIISAVLPRAQVLDVLPRRSALH